MNLMGHDVTGIDYNSKSISMGRKILDFHKIFMDELYLVLERNGIFSKKHPCNRPDFAPTSSANPYASASSQILSSGYQC